MFTKKQLKLSKIQPINFSPDGPELIDFTSVDVPVYNDNGHVQRRNHGLMTLWAGDACCDANVIYEGPGLDVDCIFWAVFFHPDNTNNLPNWILNGYHTEDVNMDGKVIFQGPNNDRDDILFFTTLMHPDNPNHYSNFYLLQEMPGH